MAAAPCARSPWRQLPALPAHVTWCRCSGPMQVRGTEEGVMATPPIVPAGWYTDPVGRHEYRYWDGTDWKPEVSDGGVTAVDPLGPAPPPLPQRRAEPAVGDPAVPSPVSDPAAPALITDSVTPAPASPRPPRTSSAWRRCGAASVRPCPRSWWWRPRARPCRRPASMGCGRSASRLSRALRTSGAYPRATVGTNRGGSARGARPGLARYGSWAISAGSDSKRPSPARAPCIEGRRSAMCFPADQARTRSPSGPR